MITKSSLVLASQSSIRAALLRSAGVPFTVCPADINEEAFKKNFEALKPEALPYFLARAKASIVNAQLPKVWTLGCDQILVCEGRLFSKSKDKHQAREKLLFLRGKTHHLYNSLVLFCNNQEMWHDACVSHVTFRSFRKAFLEDYLNALSTDVLESVGSYQYEGAGIQLCESIEGDYHAILGLPLLPLLKKLREIGLIP